MMKSPWHARYTAIDKKAAKKGWAAAGKAKKSAKKSR